MIDHRDIESVLQHFEFSQLPPELAEVSKHFHELAHHLARTIRPCRELLKSLDRLLESKDAAVRAKRVSIQSTNVRQTPSPGPLAVEVRVLPPGAPAEVSEAATGGAAKVGVALTSAAAAGQEVDFLVTDTDTYDPKFDQHMGATPFRVHMPRPRP